VNCAGRTRGLQAASHTNQMQRSGPSPLYQVTDVASVPVWLGLLLRPNTTHRRIRKLVPSGRSIRCQWNYFSFVPLYLVLIPPPHLLLVCTSYRLSSSLLYSYFRQFFLHLPLNSAYPSYHVSTILLFFLSALLNLFHSPFISPSVYFSPSSSFYISLSLSLRFLPSFLIKSSSGQSLRIRTKQMKNTANSFRDNNVFGRRRVFVLLWPWRQGNEAIIKQIKFN
jgi:hypothetical protein